MLVILTSYNATLYEIAWIEERKRIKDNETGKNV